MRTTDKAVKELLTRTAADMAANPEIRAAYAESKEAGDALVKAQTESAFLGRLAHENNMLSTLAATSGGKGDGPDAHTPGPWLIEARHPAVDTKGYVIQTGAGTVISPWVEKEADAILMAAAPEMRVQIKKLMQCVEQAIHHAETGTFNNAGAWHTALREVREFLGVNA